VSLPAFILAAGNVLIGTGSISAVTLDGSQIVFRLNDGNELPVTYSDPGAASAAFVTFTSTIAETPIVYGVDPSAPVLSSTGYVVTVIGDFFSTNAPLITVNGVPMTTSYVTANALSVILPSGSLAPGRYDVVYTDANGGTYTLSGGLNVS